jgi:ABC-2 type transport system ATP-binding protein
MRTAIEVNELSRHFGDLIAVDGLSFSVKEGEIFSLLGPNGAGKSTAIAMLCGLIRPTGGTAQVMGHSIFSELKKVKEAIGVVPQDVALYTDLSARENLQFWGRMYGLSGTQLRRRVDEVLEIIELSGRQSDKVGTFSGGMKRRVNIGAALLHRPAVVIMDEPTVGIDPQSRRHILDSIKALNREGMTVLYTTHYMEEAQELSDHIAIMDRGTVIASGTHEELVRIVGEFDRITFTMPEISERLESNWRKIEGVEAVTSDDGHATVLASDSRTVLPRLIQVSLETGDHLVSLDIEEPNLEAVFLHLTGRALRE